MPRSAIYKQAGNSVSVPIITAIAHKIKTALKGGYNFDKTVADELESLLKQNLRGDELRRVQVIYFRARYGYSQQEIAEHTGLSKGTVSNLHSRWRQQGLDMLEIKPRGGANHRYMSEHEEKEWIAYTIQKSGEEGQILTVPQIQLAYEARIGKKVAKSTVYDLLHRHGWGKRQKNGAPPGLRRS